MKQTLFLFLMVLVSGSVKAQPPVTGTVCGIYYSYDANGQRTLRKYDCIGPEITSPVATNPFNGIVYPNPTMGKTTIGFNELVQLAKLTIYRIDGVLLDELSQGESYEMVYDFTDQVPGSYVLSLYVVREDGTEAEQEFVVIRME